ncbi:hypothetical protein PR003_g1060 [Phytophthora rubi]|uniref:Uncharacterized protein n=1 Tax=Phytophthora rubi TaxID=129364 RepID=A0A6A4G4B6_9STRA|nr:hypothetical protein PR003_g1060 [Phytophthora rubi]
MAIVVLNCQILLTFVYPIYFYGFQSVGEKGQRYYVVLLPIIKILAKNLISGTLGAKYDLLPQLMIFNVDVFNALYVSSSMQTSNSITTTFVIIMLDAAQALISISDISGFMRYIVLLRRKIPDKHPLKSACFVDIALQIIKEDDQALSHLDSCHYSSAVTVLRRKFSSETSFAFRRASNPAKYATRVVPASARGVAVMVTPAGQPVPPKEDSNDPGGLLMSVFSSKERQLFVHKTAQVLFTTEFVILVEYTEVIGPLIYCIHTISMFFLPNQAYYPQLKSLDEAGLQQKIGNVLTYVTLEFLSLLVIGYVIQRKLRISMLRLISFVLDKGWRMVQANLCLWIFFTVESSVEHSGNDYSLSFSWLKGTG